MANAFTESECLHETSRRVTWLVAIAIITSQPACAFLDKVDKVSKVPGLEEAQLHNGLKKPPTGTVHTGPWSHLQAIPSVIEFGRIPIASKTQQTVVISNPADFPVTVIHVSVQGCDFGTSGDASDISIPARGTLAFTVTFQPAQRRACSGFLRLEIDSAGRRFTRVPITGRGI